MDLITIKTADLLKAKRLATDMNLVIDRMYGGMAATMRIGARKRGPMGNHEPAWNEVQRMVFTVAMEN
jgi:hypothetical protein